MRLPAIPPPIPSPDRRRERPAVQLEVAMCSDVGLVRERNEDAAYADPAGRFFLLADGMGGHAAGDVASAMAIALMRQQLEATRPRVDALAGAPSSTRRVQVKALLESAVRSVHRAVAERARREPGKRGMGCTLEVALIAGDDLFVAHVGDSRTYLVRNGGVTLLTTDHTMAQVLTSAGTVLGEDQRAALRSQLLNAIGMGHQVTIEIVQRELVAGDRILLCSDGLYEHVTKEELARRVSSGTATDLARLIDLAKQRSDDNLTGVLVAVGSLRRPHTPSRRLGTPPPIPTVRVPQAAPGQDRSTTNPLADVSDAALFSALDRLLGDDTGPIPTVVAPTEHAGDQKHWL